jgi:hypothetical protein
LYFAIAFGSASMHARGSTIKVSVSQSSYNEFRNVAVLQGVVCAEPTLYLAMAFGPARMHAKGSTTKASGLRDSTARAAAGSNPEPEATRVSSMLISGNACQGGLPCPGMNQASNN